MFVKSLVAGALVVAPVSPDVLYIQYPQVRMIECDHSSGTAFQTTEGWVSVAHVTDDTGCKIDGKPLNVTEQNIALDFSRLHAPISRYLPMQISCEGFVRGRYYWTSGYSGGLPFQRNVRIRASGVETDDGLHILVGNYTVLPGMSGGPVFDSFGTVVGTINRYNSYMGVSVSRPLSGTSLCA